MDKDLQWVPLLMILGTCVLLAGAACMQIAARESRGEEVLPFEPRRPVPWRLLEVLVIASLWMVLPVFVTLLVQRVWDLDPASDVPEIKAHAFSVLLPVDGGAKLAVVLLGFAWLIAVSGATWRDLGLDARRLGSDLKLGLVTFVLVVPPIYAIQIVLSNWWIKYDHTVLKVLEAEPTGYTYLLMAVAAVLLAPFNEEFLFRVLFQGWMEARDTRERFVSMAESPGTGPADSSPAVDAVVVPDAAGVPVVDSSSPRPGFAPIVISAALFGLVHFENGPAPVTLFLLGLALGYVYQRTHRIVPSLVVHMLLNGTSLALFWLSGQ